VLVYTPEVLWEYTPQGKSAEKVDLSRLKAEFKDLVPFQLTAYVISDVSHPFMGAHTWEKLQFKQLRDEVLGGEQTRVFQGTQKTARGDVIKRALVWVGGADGFLRKKVQYMLGKESQVELFYDVEVNTEIPDSLFKFTPDPNVKIVDKTEAYLKKLRAEAHLAKSRPGAGPGE